MDKMINWKGLSELLSNSPYKVRQNYIPKKHQKDIDELYRILKAWYEGKKLYTEDQVKKNISKIDLFAIYVEKSE